MTRFVLGTPMPHRSAWLLFAAFLAAAAPAAETERPPLVLERREAAYTEGRWLVRYRLRYRGDAAVAVPAGEIELDYRATVSNSRSPEHALPAESLAHWKPLERNRTAAPVSGEGGTNICRELLRAQVGVGDGPPPPDEALPAELTLVPDGPMWLSLSIEHEHAVHGRHEPLLGTRRIELRLGELRFADDVDLAVARSYDLPALSLVPPNNRSVDDAERQRAVLHLSPDEGGELYFRFPEVETRPGTVARVGFWYRTRRIGTGACHLRVTEYHDDEASWRRLEGGCDEALPESMEWTYFERRLTTGSSTTHLAIDFRYPDNESGESWIDGVAVRPEEPPPERP